MPRHTRTKRSRSPLLHAHGSEALNVDDELRLMRHRLASAEAELAELRAKSNAIDTLLGEGFLETKEVQSALDAHSGVDYANYAESSRAAVASRALRRHILKAFSDAASATQAGLHEIDSDTFVRCQIPHSVVPRLVSEHVVVPFLERDLLVVSKPPRTSRGPSVFPDSASSSFSDDGEPPVSVVGSTAPVPLVLDQLKRVPEDLIKTLLTPCNGGAAACPFDVTAKRDTLTRFMTFLCGLCRRATLEELQCLGEWFTAVDPDKVLLGLRTWCTVRCGNALPGTEGDFDVVASLEALTDTLLFTDVGRDEVFIPLAKNATPERAATLLNILLSSLQEMPDSHVRNAVVVFLTESTRDEFFLPLVRAHIDDPIVTGDLLSILELLASEATEAEATIFLTESVRDEVLVALVGSLDAGTLAFHLTRAAPDAARALLCTVEFRDSFFVESVAANETHKFVFAVETLIHLLRPPHGGWRDKIDPDPLSVFATEEFSEAFIGPAISRLKELDGGDNHTFATRRLGLLLCLLCEYSDLAVITEPWLPRMVDDDAFEADVSAFFQTLQKYSAALTDLQTEADAKANTALARPWYI